MELTQQTSCACFVSEEKVYIECTKCAIDIVMVYIIKSVAI